MKKEMVYSVCVVTLILSTISCAQGQQPSAKTPDEPARANEARQQQPQGLLIDDFEGAISGGADGTVDYGGGNGSMVEVTAETTIRNTGTQSLKASYDAVQDGYMYIARGFGLDAAHTAWLAENTKIDWTKYNAFSFYVYGTASNADIAFDIKDSGDEMWRCMVKDDTKGWKKVTVKFNDFFPRNDWQPDGADKNSNLDFPVKSYQFEPRTPGKGVFYFDTVELIEK